MTAVSEIAGYGALVDRLSRPVPASYSIPVAACDRWAVDPSRRALLDLSGPKERWWTFAEVRDLSLRLANALRAHGVRVGDRVGVLLPQSIEAAVTHLAVYRLGAIAVPLSVMYGPDAIAHRLRDAGCVATVSELSTWERVADEDGLGDACAWILTGSGAVPAGAVSYADMCAGGSTSLSTMNIGAETPAVIVYTSGTTGRPKGVVHGHRVVAAHAAPIHLAHDDFPQPGDLFWSPADWAWAGGLIDCLLSAWHAGVPIVSYRGRRFEPVEVLDLVSRWEVRNTFLPATALRMLRDSMSAPPPRALRSIMTGGEPVGSDIAGWSAEHLGIVPNEVYGQTEASCVLGNSRKLFAPKPGSPGLPYPGSVVSIMEPESGEMLPTGETGEIVVRADSDAVMLGYWNRPDATAEKIREGWLRTGDLGYREADGYFWFVSRRDDVILSAGYRIGPGEVEECLQGHPAVAMAAVVGTPDPERGQVVKAVVVPRDPASAGEELADALRGHVRGRLAPYEVPRVVEFVAELPRTVTGKVKRAALRGSGDGVS
jgi:acetyl-CoA synthetase